MKQPKPVTIDFETTGIEARPKYPPSPVGVSIKWPGKKARYYGFGHPTKNNSTFGEAKVALAAAYANKDGILCQNGKFDVDVAETHMGLEPPPWDKIHDTLFLLFLDDPHQLELSLKPSAERLLGLPPEEQDAVADWLCTHQPVPGVKISRSKNSDHYFGRYIALAPGDVVGPYANGDVERTEALFNLLWPRTVEREMLAAYDRERRLMPILLRMERKGVPVDLPRLRVDVAAYAKTFQLVDAWIIKQLKAPADINLDSGDQLVAAMVKAKKADPTKMPLTATGKFQTNKEALLLGVSDKSLLAMLKYRTQLKTALGTFMRPWLEMAEATGGTIHTTWNQVKAPSGDANVGTRTGRLSATWFMNMPKEFSPIFEHEETDPKKAKALVKCPIDGLPSLPLCRSYITPFPGHVLIDRDYCFGPGTEVLTEQGFLPFDELPAELKVAQWANGVVTYAKPLEYQATRFKGDLINIVGARSIDLLVTPNHQCLVAKNNHTFFARADEYPLGHYQQIHAGVSTGEYQLDPNILRLVAAIQADAQYRGGTVRWFLKKPRKVERLKHLLVSLKVAHTINDTASKPGFTTIVVHTEALPSQVPMLLSLEDGKTFSRLIMGADCSARLLFLKELALWDGSTKSDDNWVYGSTNLRNIELVAELAAVTGLRSNTKFTPLPSGKVFGSVSLRSNYLTWTQTFELTKVHYDGLVHCVTMPQGTVIVRRNGRVCVTGNSQQEPRILAHFDGGQLMEKYLEDNWIDFHDYAKAELEKMGKFYDRKPVKNTNLGLIYGMGAPKLAIKNNMSVEEADELKKAILILYPGLKAMYKDMKLRAAMKQPVRTWGGREYYCEEPKLIQGRIRQFDYKLVNVLIQGSAADCTKEAIIRLDDALTEAGLQDLWFLILNVHDQLTASVPIKDEVSAMELLRVCMEGIEFEVPMLTEGSTSLTNWAELKDYDKKGKVL